MESLYCDRSFQDLDLLWCKAGHAGKENRPVKMIVSVVFYHAHVFRDMLSRIPGERIQKLLQAMVNKGRRALRRWDSTHYSGKGKVRI